MTSTERHRAAIGGPHDGGANCTAARATAGLGRPSKPGAHSLGQAPPSLLAECSERDAGGKRSEGRSRRSLIARRAARGRPWLASSQARMSVAFRAGQNTQRDALGGPGKGDAVGAPTTQFGIYGQTYAHGFIDATSAYACVCGPAYRTHRPSRHRDATQHSPPPRPS
jgi:hypothetical protein